MTAVVALPVMCIAVGSLCTEAYAAENKGIQTESKATWTLCLYLCGSNLETKQGWASKTLKELRSSDVPDNVNVVVQAGGAAL